MPLVNSPTLTRKKSAANRANARLSRGPITPEGLIRVRGSRTKHGASAQDTGEALPMAGKGTNAEDRIESGAEVDGLARSCCRRRLSQPGLVTPAEGKNLIFFGLSWNVIDNKGPKMRRMGQMRLPWNVYENKTLNKIYLECC